LYDGHSELERIPPEWTPDGSAFLAEFADVLALLFEHALTATATPRIGNPRPLRRRLIMAMVCMEAFLSLKIDK
jgi:hypothetical protein